MTLPQTTDSTATSTDRVSDLVQKLVAAATAEVDAAAQRTRAHAQVEITQLQRTLDLLRAELQAEREEKARFAATLETVRLLVSGLDPEHHGPDPTSRPDTDGAEADDDVRERTSDADFAEFES